MSSNVVVYIKPTRRAAKAAVDSFSGNVDVIIPGRAWFLEGVEWSLVLNSDGVRTFDQLKSMKQEILLTDDERTFLQTRMTRAGFRGVIGEYLLEEIGAGRITTACTRILVWLLEEIPSLTVGERQLLQDVKRKLTKAK